MGKFSYTWNVMSASWEVLKKDKALILFPLFSGICCVLVMASFVLPLLLSGGSFTPDPNDPAQRIARYVLYFVFYFCMYFVITFFNVGITASAIAHMAGGEPTFGGAFREAFKRIHLIAAWALVQATVGMIIRIVEERSKWVGRVIAAIMGMAWTITTMLVVPILVVEEKGPFEAVKESGKLLAKTWGAELKGRFSFGLIFFLLGLPAYALIFFGLAMARNLGGGKMVAACVALAVVYLIFLALVQSALMSIFHAALYMYTQGAMSGGQGFPVTLLKGALE
jgi:hypothetical protein